MLPRFRLSSRRAFSLLDFSSGGCIIAAPEGEREKGEPLKYGEKGEGEIESPRNEDGQRVPDQRKGVRVIETLRRWFGLRESTRDGETS